MALSNQLERLAQQAKDIEHSAELMRTENAAKIDARRVALTDQLDAFRSRVKADVTATGDAAEAAFSAAQHGFRSDLEASSADALARRTKRAATRADIRADFRADFAESDAADAVAYAAFVLREAELAVLAASEARTKSDQRVSAPAGAAPAAAAPAQAPAPADAGAPAAAADAGSSPA